MLMWELYAAQTLDTVPKENTDVGWLFAFAEFVWPMKCQKMGKICPI